MQPFTLSEPALLTVASRFVSADKTRHYLHGVRIEPHAGGAYVVATCGHMLFAAYDPACTAEKSCVITIMPKPELPYAWAKTKAVLEVDPAAGMMMNGSLVAKVHVDPDTSYPDWRRLVKSVGQQEIAPVRGFNPDYLTHIASAAYALGNKGALGCRQTGEFEPMLFELAHNAIAICMPATHKVPVVTPPAWLADPDAMPVAAE